MNKISIDSIGVFVKGGSIIVQNEVTKVGKIEESKI